MKQLWRMVLVALLVGTSLSACSPKSTPSPAPTLEAYPSPVQAEPANPTPVQGVLAYPSPDSDSPTNPSPGSGLPTYPSPGEELPSYNPYPEPGEGVNNFLEWARVEELILGGKVARVYHTQTMNITLELKDGSMAVTIEPVLDEVIKVIERCGQACSDIELIEQ